MVFEDSEIQKLNQIAEIIESEEGEILFQANDVGDSVYLVISGVIDHYTKFSDTLE